MSLLLTWAVFPLLLLALCAGLGLLIDALSGRCMPGTLVLPAGLAGFVVAAEVTTSVNGGAQLTSAIVVLLAGIGMAFALPWRFAPPDPWLLIAAVGVFCVFAAPIVLSGQPTIAGYIKLDDTATWLAMTDRLMEQGHSLSGLPPSSYRATLEAYTGAGYPIGANLPWGAASVLMGQDVAWTFQPYLAVLASMLCLTIGSLCRPFVSSRKLAALIAFLAAQSALFYGYYLWGGMKEIAAAALVAFTAGALQITARRAIGPSSRLTDARAALPLAVGVAALASVLSPAGLVWIGPLLLGGAVWAVSDLGLRRALIRGAWLAGITAMLAIPLFAVGRLTPPVEHAVTDPNAVLNLLRPLHPLQVLGVWPSGDFRLRPQHLSIAWFLAALTAGLAAFGAGVMLRRRAWRLAAYVGTSALTCGAIAYAGSPWVEGKAMATAAPAFLLAALIGGAAIYQGGLRFEGGVLIAVLAAGVLWSNVLAYGGVNLAPYAQLRELESIGNEFAGQGPTLMTEYNPYGVRHFLRKEEGEGASELRTRPLPLQGGGTAEKGVAVDLDELETAGLLDFRTLVLRRSPVRSRPPSPYRLARSGKYYEVWQRPVAPQVELLEHLPLGDAAEPMAVPNCSVVRRLAKAVMLNGPAGARLIAARHAPVLKASAGSVAVERAGLYTAWLEGSVRGTATIYVDGRDVGEARHQLENLGGFIELGTTRLGRGTHKVELRLGGPDLNPGSGGFPRPAAGPLLFAPARDQAGTLFAVPASEADRLCGKRWDWIEAVGPTRRQ